MAFGMSPFPLQFGTRGGGGFDFFADSILGLDANAGTSAASAFRTMTALGTAVSSGERVKIQGQFNETLDLTDKTGIEVIGAEPTMIGNFGILSAATQEDGATYPNVWLFAGGETAEEAILYPGVYVTDALATLAGRGIELVSMDAENWKGTSEITGDGTTITVVGNNNDYGAIEFPVVAGTAYEVNAAFTAKAGNSQFRVRSGKAGAGSVIKNTTSTATLDSLNCSIFPTSTGTWNFEVLNRAASASATATVSIKEVQLNSAALTIAGRLRRVGTSAQNVENAIIVEADKAACLANVNANTGRFYYEYTDSTHKYYVNAGSSPSTDNKIYARKSEESVTLGNENGTFQNIQFIGSAARNGVIRDNSLVGRRFKNCMFRDGGIHVALPGGGKLFQDTTSIANPDSGSTNYHLNTPSYSEGAAYVRATAFGAFAVGRADLIGGTAYYSHGADIDVVSLIDVEAHGVGEFADYDDRVLSKYIVGARVNTKLGDLSGVWPTLEGDPFDFPYGSYGVLTQDWYSEDGLYYLGGTHGIIWGSGEIRFHNERFVFRPGRNDAAAPGRTGVFSRAFDVTGVDVVFSYCTIVLDTYGDDLQSSVNNLVYQEIGTCSGTIVFDHCILVVNRPNATTMRINGTSPSVVVTMADCVISSGFTNLPGSGYTESSDIFDTAESWRTGDWTLSGTSPAIAADAGWREDRTPIYRPTAVAIAQALGASVS